MKKKIALRYTIFLSVTQKLIPVLLMVFLFSARSYSQGNNYHRNNNDSIYVGHMHDSLPPFPHDSFPPPPPPPPHPHHDSIPIRHDSIAPPPPPFPHDSFPAFHHDSFPPPPPPHDSIPIRHDSIAPPPPPPFPHDSFPPFPHDSFPPPPPHDSIPIHHDSIAPPPPFPHDSFPPPPPHDSIPIHHDSIAPPPPFPHDSFPPPPPPPPHDSTGGKGPREEVSAATSAMTANIYPNPVVSDAVLHIENSANGNVSFVLFNISGKMVVSETNLSNGDYSLNRSELGSGMYFYKVYDTNNNIVTGKIIIQ